MIMKRKFSTFSDYWKNHIVERNFGDKVDKEKMISILEEDNPIILSSSCALCVPNLRQKLYDKYCNLFLGAAENN